MKSFKINKAISKAYTMPGRFYHDTSWLERSKDLIFTRTWHYAADQGVVDEPGRVYPFTLLPDFLNEPLLFSKTKEGDVHCMSNVCTHRGNILVQAPGKENQLRCGYHGKCFYLDGKFKSMPMFDGAKDFPSRADDLPAVSFANWMGMYFVSLHPKFSFWNQVSPIVERMEWLPLEKLQFVEEASREYHVKAHWALYCDNYLEGFHIPFVHPALNKALDFKEYHTEIFPYCNLQLGIADSDQPCFNIPANAKDYGKRVYAYYWWVFPNLMFNFYPWGLSLNVVQPIDTHNTRILFRTYRFEDQPFEWENNQLDMTEIEDEEVVESVQVGTASRLYKRGRFSPAMEKGVHHFHRLLAQYLANPG